MDFCNLYYTGRWGRTAEEGINLQCLNFVRIDVDKSNDTIDRTSVNTVYTCNKFYSFLCVHMDT